MDGGYLGIERGGTWYGSLDHTYLADNLTIELHVIQSGHLLNLRHRDGDG